MDDIRRHTIVNFSTIKNVIRLIPPFELYLRDRAFIWLQKEYCVGGLALKNKCKIFGAIFLLGEILASKLKSGFYDLIMLN